MFKLLRKSRHAEKGTKFLARARIHDIAAIFHPGNLLNHSNPTKNYIDLNLEYQSSLSPQKYFACIKSLQSKNLCRDAQLISNQ